MIAKHVNEFPVTMRSFPIAGVLMGKDEAQGSGSPSGELGTKAVHPLEGRGAGTR